MLFIGRATICSIYYCLHFLETYVSPLTIGKLFQINCVVGRTRVGMFNRKINDQCVTDNCACFIQ